MWWVRALQTLALAGCNHNLQGYLLYGADERIYVIHCVYSIVQTLGTNALNHAGISAGDGRVGKIKISVIMTTMTMVP